MGGDGRGGFGHAPAVAWQRAELLVNPPDQLGRGWCAAVTDRLKAGEIVVRPVRVLEQLPGNRRHPAGCVDLFALDNPEGLHRIPLVHEDQRVPAGDRTHHRRRARRGVEQRDHGQHRFAGRCWQCLAPAQDAAGGGITARQDIGGQVPVGAERALGIAGGAGSIEDRRRIICGNRDVRQIGIGKRGPACRTANDVFQPGRPRYCAACARYQHLFERGQFGKVRCRPVQPFGIADQHLGT